MKSIGVVAMVLSAATGATALTETPVPPQGTRALFTGAGLLWVGLLRRRRRRPAGSSGACRSGQPVTAPPAGGFGGNGAAIKGR
jgi:hypothetical protein